MSIINKEAELKVKHLLWAMGIFKIVIGGITWFVLWYLSHNIDQATRPLQTKGSFQEWKEKEWKPLLHEQSKANVSIGILLDRTDSRSRSTNSIGRHGMSTTAPPPQ